jgi:hypothetical protein
MRIALFAELFQFYYASLVAYSPGDNLPGMLPVVSFDDGPTAMRAIVASPFKVMEIARRVNFPDDCITITGVVR